MTPSIQPTRQIVLDTETTGMNQFGAHYEGHCIIEIGAVEMINRRLTGNNFHIYIKPDRPVDPDAIKVHGITDEMLADKPTFNEIAQQFIEYIQGAELLIHNASFDIGFMDYEFRKLNMGLNTSEICLITDTLQMARQMYPGKRNSLDALCDRLGIDNSKRTLHGALLDAEILADVYLTMTGGQTSLFDESEPEIVVAATQEEVQSAVVFSQDLKKLMPTEEELQAHIEYIKLLNKKSKGNCLWEKRLSEENVH
ncbi:TPA: DNA polymerase III subunit epsilon [Pasteurella multocida]|nr:DNA polymerase III subunit epsilon [Pasteurella multocida]